MDLLERVFARCEEVDDCWEWLGATQSSGSTPVMSWYGRPAGVRRLLMQYAGVNVGSRVATYSCGNQLCVAPHHLQAVTRAVLQRRSNKSVDYKSVQRSILLARSMRASTRTRLNEAAAAEIRASEGATTRELAAKYGVSQHAICDVLRGRTWKDFSNPFSQLLHMR